MNELEERLRAMLRERAGDVTRVPSHVLALPSERPHSTRRVAWLVAAAVAIVLALAAALVAVSGNGYRSAPAVSKPPVNSSTATPTPTTVARSTCATSLPRTWAAAVSSGTSRYGANAAFPLAVAADGRSLLITRDYGSSRDVALVDHTGHAHPIYTVPQPDVNQVIDAYLDGHDALLDLDYAPRNSNGVIPTVLKIVMIDLRTSSAKVLDHTTARDYLKGERTIRRAVMWHGHVYWDVGPTFATDHPVIRDYDVATGRTTTAGHAAAMGGPQLSPEGVIFGGTNTDPADVRADVPQPVTALRPTRLGGLVSDVHAYAWITSKLEIAWWAPGRGQARIFRAAGVSDANIEGVAGPYAFFVAAPDANSPSTLRVLDTRTGATAQLARLGTGLQPYMLAGNGVLASYGFSGAFKDSPTTVIRIDTSKLPELHC